MTLKYNVTKIYYEKVYLLGKDIICDNLRMETLMLEEVYVMCVQDRDRTLNMQE